MPITDADAERIAGLILAAGDKRRSISPITEGLPGFDLADAYRVSAVITRLRIARGERPVGWKIGFTNETIWDEYGVHAPIWGPMYSSTAAEVEPAGGTSAGSARSSSRGSSPRSLCASRRRRIPTWTSATSRLRGRRRARF